MSPGVHAPMINGFGYIFPSMEKVINSLYMHVIKRIPILWDVMYDNPRVAHRSQFIQNFLHRTSHEKLEKLFERHNPDTVVCSQAFPCGMVADFKMKNKLKTRIIGVLTDFAPHSYWINEGVDYYIVPSMEIKDRFIKKGIHPDAIKVYGIPLKPKFTMQLDRKPIAKKLGIDLKIPTLLVMGGGQGLGPILKIVKSLIKTNVNFQTIVLAGTNKKVVEQLERFSRKTDKKILIYEFATNVDELMEIATLIITKPGGLTTAESLTKGLPMVIVNPIPGQEMRNTDFLIKNGIGIRIDDTEDVGEEVEILLKSPERLSAMRKAAYENAKPHAVYDIARLILNQPEGQNEDSKTLHFLTHD